MTLPMLNYFIYLADISLHVFVRHLVVLERAGEVLVVGCHVDETVAGEIEEDDLFLARGDTFLGLLDGCCNGMAASRGAYKSRQGET